METCPEEITSGGTRYTHEAQGTKDMYVAEGKKGARDEGEHTWQYCIDKSRGNAVYFFNKATKRTEWILPDIFDTPSAQALAQAAAKYGRADIDSDTAAASKPAEAEEAKAEPVMKVKGVTERSASRRSRESEGASPADSERATPALSAVSAIGSSGSRNATPMSYDDTRKSLEEELKRKMMERLGKSSSTAPSPTAGLTAPAATSVTPLEKKFSFDSNAASSEATASKPEAEPEKQSSPIEVSAPTSATASPTLVVSAPEATSSEPAATSATPDSAAADASPASGSGRRSRDRGMSVREKLALHRQRAASGRRTPDSRSGATTPANESFSGDKNAPSHTPTVSGDGLEASTSSPVQQAVTVAASPPAATAPSEVAAPAANTAPASVPEPAPKPTEPQASPTSPAAVPEPAPAPTTAVKEQTAKKESPITSSPTPSPTAAATVEQLPPQRPASPVVQPKPAPVTEAMRLQQEVVADVFTALERERAAQREEKIAAERARRVDAARILHERNSTQIAAATEAMKHRDANINAAMAQSASAASARIAADIRDHTSNEAIDDGPRATYLELIRKADEAIVAGEATADKIAQEVGSATTAVTQAASRPRGFGDDGSPLLSHAPSTITFDGAESGEDQTLSYSQKFSYVGQVKRHPRTKFLLKEGTGTYYYNAERESYYEGEWKDDMKHGEGCISLAHSYSEGRWAKGKLHGRAVVQSASLKASLSFQDGAPNGNALVQMHTGEAFSGKMRAGSVSSIGSLMMGSGDRVEWTWEEPGNPGTGNAVIQFASGDVYAGHVSRWAASGTGAFKSVDGDELSGTFANGVLDAVGGCVYRMVDGSVYEGGFRGGLFHGNGTFTAPDDGFVYEGEWRQGMMHGKGSLRFSNGDVWRGTFEKDRRVAGKYVISSQYQLEPEE